MNAELPDDLQALDDELKQAMRSFAPPADLDAGIVAHVSRRSRWRILPTSGMTRAASAVAAASLLATIGYVADRQMNGGRSSLLGDLERLVAYDTRRSSRGDTVPSAYYLQDDIAYFSSGPELRPGREAQRQADGQKAVVNEASEELRGPVGESEYTRNDGGLSNDLSVNTSRGEDEKAQQGQWTRETADDGVHLPSSNSYTDKTKGAPGALTSDRDAKSFSFRVEGKNAEGGEEDRLSRVTGTESFKPGDSGPTSRPVVGTKLGDAVAMKAPGSSGTADPAKEQPSQAGWGQAGPAEPPAPPQTPPVAVRQKVIRNGTVEFEVESFDTSLMTITKLVVESGGFVASTDSSKLPNGKTRGAVTLRVPPERLDTFVLMLRGIGDLKSQKIAAQDVSKQYTDIESQLRAAHAMEERLLEMIKKGNGAIKDLLAAEKELGVWREKIEKFEGEIRYYDNLIGLSTLSVVLQERDIKASAASIETETVSAGVETDDVEKARAEILKAIDEAKGRIITSELKKLDAGQFAATIVAEVAPDRSGPVVDRLKQLGKVARLEVDRKQTTVDGTSAPLPGARVEQQPTRFTISLYNLANVAPRLTTTATLASGDVEAGYKQIMTLVEKAGGRIVTSQLQRPQPDQIVATLQIEVPSAQAAATQAAITGLGEMMNLQLSENPDTANVTTAKQGFSVRMISAAGVAARETVTLQLASPDVVKAHQTLTDLAATLEARVVQSNVTEGNGDSVNAVLQVDLPRAAIQEWDQARQDAGDVLTRSVVRSTDIQNTLDSKLRINLTLFPADRLPPRQVTTATLRVRSSESQEKAFLAQATQLGGRLIDQTVTLDTEGRGTARIVFDVPRDKAATIFEAMRSAGEIRSMNTSTNPQAPEGPLSRTRFELQLSEGEALVGAENGLWSSIKAGLATSLKGLGYSLRLLVVAICLVAPWALVLWGGWKLMRRKAKMPTQ